MQRTIKRRVDGFSGDGRLTRDGQDLGTTRYDITVYQDFVVLPDGEELEGLKSLHIVLSRHSLDTFVLWQESATLTLKLSDGRQVTGFLDGNKLIPSSQLA